MSLSQPAQASTSPDLTLVVHNPEIYGGEPTIRNTRIAVTNIVDVMEYSGEVARVYEAYPSLPPGGVEAALAYAAAHPEEMEWARKRHEEAYNAII